MLPPTFSKICCADCRRGDINFPPFLIEKNWFEKNVLPKYKYYFHEVKFSVGSAETSAKNHLFPFS